MSAEKVGGEVLSPFESGVHVPPRAPDPLAPRSSTPMVWGAHLHLHCKCKPFDHVNDFKGHWDVFLFALDVMTRLERGMSHSNSFTPLNLNI